MVARSRTDFWPTTACARRRPDQFIQPLLRPVLNFLAGPLHVLAEAMGRVAADADDGQDGGGKKHEY